MFTDTRTMKHTAITLSLFAFGALVLSTACSSETEAAGPPQGATAKSSEAAAVVAEPQVAALVSRAQARWQLIENEDWIQSYSYLAKEIREFQDLGAYLSGASVHEYIVKQEPLLVGQDGLQAYVQVLVEWTPTHPELKNAANADQGSLTQDIDMIETWTWENGDWFFVNGARARDFIQEHPSLFRRKGEKAPEAPETAVLEGDELK